MQRLPVLRKKSMSLNLCRFFCDEIITQAQFNGFLGIFSHLMHIIIFPWERGCCFIDSNHKAGDQNTGKTCSNFFKNSISCKNNTLVADHAASDHGPNSFSPLFKSLSFIIFEAAALTQQTCCTSFGAVSKGSFEQENHRTTWTQHNVQEELKLTAIRIKFCLKMKNLFQIIDLF